MSRIKILKLIKMKKVLLAFILMHFSFFAFSQNNKLEEKNGLRDIKLGSPKSRYNDLYRIESKNPCGEMYQRSNENLFIGNLKVHSIQYNYMGGTLAAVYVIFKEDDDWLKFAKSLYEVYGKPDILDEENQQIEWIASSFRVSVVDKGASYVKKDFSRRCKE
jgi:hypothetical protein